MRDVKDYAEQYKSSALEGVDDIVWNLDIVHQGHDPIPANGAVHVCQKTAEKVAAAVVLVLLTEGAKPDNHPYVHHEQAEQKCLGHLHEVEAHGVNDGPRPVPRADLKQSEADQKRVRDADSENRKKEKEDFVYYPRMHRHLEVQMNPCSGGHALHFASDVGHLVCQGAFGQKIEKPFPLSTFILQTVPWTHKSALFSLILFIVVVTLYSIICPRTKRSPPLIQIPIILFPNAIILLDAAGNDWKLRVEEAECAEAAQGQLYPTNDHGSKNNLRVHRV
mmetsp:Transcript_4253/g.10911  ORF Transcript_4253/g.10911 Transcript_4253/m.10911 type:complete len:278 (-) Transcript_4253:7508-8341(-)